MPAAPPSGAARLVVSKSKKVKIVVKWGVEGAALHISNNGAETKRDAGVVQLLFFSPAG